MHLHAKQYKEENEMNKDRIGSALNSRGSKTEAVLVSGSCHSNVTSSGRPPKVTTIINQCIYVVFILLFYLIRLLINSNRLLSAAAAATDMV
jgi:hypothetical protein